MGIVTSGREAARRLRPFFFILLLLLLLVSAGCKKSRKYLPLLPYATVETPSGVQDGIIEITCTLYNNGEQQTDVLIEFTADGVAYETCTMSPGGTSLTGLATNATGISYTFKWNSVSDSLALTSQVDTVRVKVTPYQLDIGDNPYAGYCGVSDEFSVDNSTGNTPPVVAITSSPSGIESNNITVWYSITDAEADMGYIEVLFQTEASAGWQPATLSTATGGDIENNLVANMTCPIPPTIRRVTWDSEADLGLTYFHNVQIRITGCDARTGTPADSEVFHVDNTTALEAPIIAFVTPASPSRGLVTVEYEISDNNAETANILFELSLDSGSTWQKPALAYSNSGTRVANSVLGVPCLPWPEMRYVIWDSPADIGISACYAVRFRARPQAEMLGSWYETGDFAVDNTSAPGGPTAVITADRLSAMSGETINFSATSSTGSPTTFLWDFGDGSYSPATEPSHVFDTGAQEFNVFLTVTDAAGKSDTAVERILIAEEVSDYRSELEPYRNPAETRALLENLADSYPNLMSIYTIGYSVQGREIFAIKISDNVQVDEDEPVIHFDAEHHAREVMTPEVIVDIIETLVSNYATSSEIKGWVDSYETYLIPCVNPDSVVAVFEEYWGIRKNANGVDLNRNYPADWGNPDGSSSNPESETYRGPFPASEPEVQTLMAQVFRTRPAAGITFHSYSNILLYPYSSPGLTQTSQENYLQQVSEDMASVMTKDVGGAYVASHGLWYDASGVTPDWMYRDAGTFCILVEVGDAMGGGLNGFHPNYAAYHDPQVAGVRPGVMELYRYMGRGAICGHVTDADTGDPLEAEISVSGFDKNNSEIRRSEPLYGSYYYLWQDGNFTVTFEIEGYQSQSHGVTVAGVPFLLDVELVKNATGNHRPTADFTASFDMIEAGTAVLFDASGSTDEDGDNLSFYWNFGDNQTSGQQAVTHVFNRTGTHRVVLRVSDGNGGEHDIWKLIHVFPETAAPVVSLMPVTGTWSKNVYIDYSLKAKNSGTCSVAVEYTSDGLIWHPATLSGTDEGVISGNTVSSVSMSSEPVSHYFLWDTVADLGKVDSTVIALKITPFIPGEIYGDPAITNLFTVDNNAPNSPPSLALNVQNPPLFMDIYFSGLITDSDYEACSLTVEYSTTAGTTWLAATLSYCDEGIIAGNTISGLAASPSGKNCGFAWDSFGDLGKTAALDIWVRVTPSDSESTGTPVILTGIDVENTGLEILTPVLSHVADATCEITWNWASTSGSSEQDLVYEIDCSAGTGEVYFADDFAVEQTGQWQLTGTSHRDAGSEYMILDNTSAAGGIWHSDDISTDEWYCSFRFRIAGGTTARGLYFSFFSEPTTLQYPNTGYTVEFDAYYNAATDPVDTRHVALLDGTGAHLSYSTNHTFSDGSWHTAEVYYKNGLLLVDLDGSNVLGYWLETPDKSHLRFGFGARYHDGITYYLDDVFLSNRKPAWNQIVTSSDSLGTSGGTGIYTWVADMVSSGYGYIIRIRAFDGSNYSSYVFSQPFSIEHAGPPSVNIIDPSGVKQYEVSLGFTLNDSTNDICTVSLSFSPNAGEDWYDATIKSCTEGTLEGNSILGLSGGTTQLYTVTWDAWRDLGEVDNPNVRLMLQPSDILPGLSSETVDFQVDNTGHPGEIQNFSATENGGAVELAWTNPASPSLYGIRIVRKEGDFPGGPSDGDIVCDSQDTGFYFDNTTMSGQAMFLRQDGSIDFPWGTGSPDGSLPVDGFSARWTATVDIASPGPYNFFTVTDDGVRLLVDGNLLVESWIDQSASEFCGYAMLDRGTHRIVMEYFENGGDAEAHLFFNGPGIARSAVMLLPGHPDAFTDYGVSSGTTYYYAGFTYTLGGAFSTSGDGARDSVTP